MLVLLDFSKAYDTVWRQKILTSLLEKGMPKAYVKWLHGFLQTDRPELDSAVLAPILFTLYINNLAELLPESTTNAIYADDVSILDQSTTKEETERLAQETVNIVVSWIKKWKLNLLHQVY